DDRQRVRREDRRFAVDGVGDLRHGRLVRGGEDVGVGAVLDLRREVGWPGELQLDRHVLVLLLVGLGDLLEGGREGGGRGDLERDRPPAVTGAGSGAAGTESQEGDGAQGAEGGPAPHEGPPGVPMTTLVDLMDATATTPGSRPRASAASRDMRETTRKGPACRLTWAMTPSR